MYIKLVLSQPWIYHRLAEQKC